MQRKLQIALLCGGPSLERGISLNSARSVLDHLQDENIIVSPIYFDFKKNAYSISRSQLYCNTPSDFDFKLKRTAKPLSQEQLLSVLKDSDIAFVAMHGAFGEDGEIQTFLEKNNIPYIGASSESCKNVFDKFKANESIKKLGFHTLPSCVLKIYKKDHNQILKKFFEDNKITRAAVKPACGGSSIGVFSVSTPEEAKEKADLIFSKRMDTRVVVEQFAEGQEFTVIILQNKFGQPVAVIPTEIETDYTEHQIFDFRKKYLPTRHVTYHCPPRFSNETIERIQVQAEQLFSAFGFNDFARFDGWVLPSGKLWFSDFNPISGMEQNSFLFQQASRVGLSHREVLRHIVRNACSRYNIKFPSEMSSSDILLCHPRPDRESDIVNSPKKPVNVLFGGKTSERQVSLMSGTNVWLKLKKSALYRPEPYLLDADNNVWHLPYALTLNHTVEEILENCKKYDQGEERLSYLEEKVRLRLALDDNIDLKKIFKPEKYSLDTFLRNSKYVFNALHGGEGENGVLQSKLEKAGVLYNGPDSKTSALCADKYATNQKIQELNIRGVKVVKSKVENVEALLSQKNISAYWSKLQKELDAKTVIVKPRADGCSSGIVRLWDAEDLKKYLSFIENKAKFIPKNTFRNQAAQVEMPSVKPQELMFEKYVRTDSVKVKNNQLKYRKISGWVEITIGVLGEKGEMHALNPSMTIAEGEVLSVEEKFQGGTGVNITPPPAELVSREKVRKVRQNIEKLANAIGISGYSRIDAFMHLKSGNLIIIEINTLPGLTPSTVLYHQGLAEKTPIYPTELLENIISYSGY